MKGFLYVTTLNEVLLKIYFLDKGHLLASFGIETSQQMAIFNNTPLSGRTIKKHFINGHSTVWECTTSIMT